MAGIIDHTLKPACAATTAASTSAWLACWTLQITRLVAGLIVSKVSPEVASTYPPLMYSCWVGSVVEALTKSVIVIGRYLLSSGQPGGRGNLGTS